MNSDSFATRLRAIIGGASVNSFAEKSGVPEASIRTYLRGSLPGIDKAAALARAGGVSLDWLWFGEGAGPGEATSLAGAMDDELMGRVTDAIARLYKDQRVSLAPIDLGRLAGRKYAEIVAAAADADERAAMLKLVITQLRNDIKAASAQPGTGKRSA
ncbi:helix-turn-helix transcriptional regulator [Xanthobacter sp.]|uniref:helix-turn-helix domain-containing protein n=1 Tax=Xanthobacter sp. TaxID=35809 RepID=UPI0025F2CD50|nr:helix-turn-helix transcriptional regulator [Xanthobacter sp.]